MRMSTTSAVVAALVFTVAISSNAQTDPDAAARFAAAQAALNAKPRAATQPAVKQITGPTAPSPTAGPATRPSLKLKADTPENVKVFIQECEANKAVLLEKCKADVKSAREAVNKAIAKPVSSTGNQDAYNSSSAKRDAVLAAKAALKSCEDGLKLADEGSPLIAPPPLKMENGKIGTIRGYFVVQIIDAKNMLAHPAMLVGENVGTDTMPVYTYSLKPVDDIVWFGDFNTAGMTDKSRSADDKQLFECVGTKQYDTTAGSPSTVKLLRPFDINQYVAK